MMRIIKNIVKNIIKLILVILYRIKNMLLPHHNKIIISIDGNIGSGKSTFLNMLKERYSDEFYFAKEPVDEWLNINGHNLLEKFYNDKERWSYTFQNYAYITRVIELCNGLKSNKQIIITERSVNTDKNIFAKMLTEDKFMSDFELDLYNTWFNHFDIKVEGQIYVRTELDNCVNRIQQRNRDGEDAIDKTYLSHLEKKHEEWLMNKNDILILDGNLNFKDDESIQNAYIELFEKYIKNLKQKVLNDNIKVMSNKIDNENYYLLQN